MSSLICHQIPAAHESAQLQKMNGLIIMFGFLSRVVLVTNSLFRLFRLFASVGQFEGFMKSSFLSFGVIEECFSAQ